VEPEEELLLDPVAPVVSVPGVEPVVSVPEVEPPQDEAGELAAGGAALVEEAGTRTLEEAPSTALEGPEELFPELDPEPEELEGVPGLVTKVSNCTPSAIGPAVLAGQDPGGDTAVNPKGTFPV